MLQIFRGFLGFNIKDEEVRSESLEALKKRTTSYGWFYSSRLCSVLSSCQWWRPTGPRYSGWIWNESGHFIAFSLEKPGDLVLLEKNSKLSGELDLDSLNFWMWAAFWLVAVFGAALALGCVLLLCAVLCCNCLLCNMCISIKVVSLISTRLNIVTKRWNRSSKRERWMIHFGVKNRLWTLSWMF